MQKIKTHYVALIITLIVAIIMFGAACLLNQNFMNNITILGLENPILRITVLALAATASIGIATGFWLTHDDGTFSPDDMQTTMLVVVSSILGAYIIMFLGYALEGKFPTIAKVIVVLAIILSLGSILLLHIASWFHKGGNAEARRLAGMTGTPPAIVPPVAPAPTAPAPAPAAPPVAPAPTPRRASDWYKGVLPLVIAFIIAIIFLGFCNRVVNGSQSSQSTPNGQTTNTAGTATGTVSATTPATSNGATATVNGNASTGANPRSFPGAGTITYIDGNGQAVKVPIAGTGTVSADLGAQNEPQ